MQIPIKMNALGTFACKIRREIGNCEHFQKCDARWDADKNARCSIDQVKMSKATITDLVELLRDRVGVVNYSESDEPLYRVFVLVDRLVVDGRREVGVHVFLVTELVE